MTCVHTATTEQVERLLVAIENREQADADYMPTEREALQVMQRAYTRLKSLGWNDASYAPKDGAIIEVIEAGSTSIHRAHYAGPCFWVHDAGDLWPSKPILYRLVQEAAPVSQSPKGEKPQASSAQHADAVLAKPVGARSLSPRTTDRNQP